MGIEPMIFGLRDRRLTTWPPRLTIGNVCSLTIVELGEQDTRHKISCAL